MNFNLDWDRSVIDSKVIQRSQAKDQKPIVVTNIFNTSERGSQNQCILVHIALVWRVVRVVRIVGTTQWLLPKSFQGPKREDKNLIVVTNISFTMEIGQVSLNQFNHEYICIYTCTQHIYTCTATYSLFPKHPWRCLNIQNRSIHEFTAMFSIFPIQTKWTWSNIILIRRFSLSVSATP